MVETDGPLQNEQQRRRETRPAFAQDQVVSVLNAQARGATNQIEWIEQLLNVEKADFPRLFLGGENRFESFRCTLMSSARVVENDGQFAQWSPESVEWPLAANTLVLAIFEQFCVASKFVFGIRSFFTEMTNRQVARHIHGSALPLR